MTTTPVVWKSATQVNTTDLGLQWLPDILALPDGGYVVCWLDVSGVYDDPGSEILGQRYNFLGEKGSFTEIDLSLFVSDDTDPALALLSDGSVAVAFINDSLGNWDGYVQRYNADLSPNSTDFVAGDQKFKFIGTADFHKRAGELHYIKGSKTIVEGDVNGDGKADFQIELTGSKTLTGADFIV